VACISGLFDCSSAGRDPSGARTRETAPEVPAKESQPLIGGSAYNFWPSVVQITYYGELCTGTVIGPRHVLTVKHCFPRDVLNFGAPAAGAISLSDNGVNQTAGIIGIISNLAADGVVLVTDQDLQAEPIDVSSEPEDQWVGRRVLDIGTGGPSFTKQGAWRTITSLSADGTSYNYGVAGEASTCGGDSGGPDLAWYGDRWHVVGLHFSGSCSVGANSTSIRADKLVPWLLSVAPLRGSHVFARYSRNLSASGTPGIFNNHTTGTGQNEVVTNAGGTSLIADGVAQWTAPSTNRWTLGRAEAMLGVFDSSGKASLGVLTPIGFEIYPASGSGFGASPTVTTDANIVDPNGRPKSWAGSGAPFGTQIGVGRIAFADFTGDGLVDVLLADTNGTSLYMNQSGALTSTWSGSYHWYDSTYTVEDFNGDGRADVLVQTSAGATLLTGASSGQFSSITVGVAGAQTPSLSRGSAHITPGRFGLGGVDLVVATTQGTYLLEPSAAVGHYLTVWNRSDILPNETAYVVGDYNGDSLDDLMFVNTSGSYLYLGTGSSSSPWTPNAWVRNDLPIDSTTYDSRDMDGDGIDDLWIVRPEGSYGYHGHKTSPYLSGAWGPDTAKRLGTFVLR
jgi:hypothetical protein